MARHFSPIICVINESNDMKKQTTHAKYEPNSVTSLPISIPVVEALLIT